MHSTPKFPHCFVEGDEFPELVCTLVDVDLSTFTVTLHLRRQDGSVLIKPAVGIDFTQGKFKFPWVSTDLVFGFNQEAEIQFVDDGDKPLTSERFLIDVRREIA